MITTDGYREKSSDTIIFMCIIEKVTAIGRVTAIGYRPAIGCNMYFGHGQRKALISLTVFEAKSEMRVHIRFACICNIFRVRGVIVRMPYLPSRKVHLPNSICLDVLARALVHDHFQWKKSSNRGYFSVFLRRMLFFFSLRAPGEMSDHHLAAYSIDQARSESIVIEPMKSKPVFFHSKSWPTALQLVKLDLLELSTVEKNQLFAYYTDIKPLTQVIFHSQSLPQTLYLLKLLFAY